MDVRASNAIAADPERLGKRLRELRRGAGLTQLQVAREMGTSRGALAKIENGWTLPGLDTLGRFCTAVGVRVSDVLVGAGAKGDVF